MVRRFFGGRGECVFVVSNPRDERLGFDDICNAKHRCASHSRLRHACGCATRAVQRRTPPVDRGQKRPFRGREWEIRLSGVGTTVDRHRTRDADRHLGCPEHVLDVGFGVGRGERVRADRFEVCTRLLGDDLPASGGRDVRVGVGFELVKADVVRSESFDESIDRVRRLAGVRISHGSTSFGRPQRNIGSRSPARIPDTAIANWCGPR